jgi:hypothetical protein
VNVTRVPTCGGPLARQKDLEPARVAALVHRQALLLLEDAVDQLAGPVDADPVDVVLVAAMRGRTYGDPNDVRAEDRALLGQRQTIPPVDEVVSAAGTKAVDGDVPQQGELLPAGLWPVNLYSPGDTESANLPLLPTVAVNSRPAELLAVTCPGRATGAPIAGPP